MHVLKFTIHTLCTRIGVLPSFSFLPENWTFSTSWPLSTSPRVCNFLLFCIILCSVLVRWRTAFGILLSLFFHVKGCHLEKEKGMRICILGWDEKKNRRHFQCIQSPYSPRNSMMMSFHRDAHRTHFENSPPITNILFAVVQPPDFFNLTIFLVRFSRCRHRREYDVRFQTSLRSRLGWRIENLNNSIENHMHE